MKLIDAVVAAAKMLKLDYIDETIRLDDKVVSTLVDCANLVVNEIATEYFPVLTSEIIQAKPKVQYRDLQEKILEIVKINFGRTPIQFKIYPLHFEIDAKINGEIEVYYNLIPKDMQSLDEEINLDNKITTRTIAYGICSEYFVLNGLYDEALMFDKKYRDSLMALSKRRNLHIGVNRWI